MVDSPQATSLIYLSVSLHFIMYSRQKTINSLLVISRNTRTNVVPWESTRLHFYEQSSVLNPTLGIEEASWRLHKLAVGSTLTSSRLALRDMREFDEV
jgi:hypothetical protein